MKSTHTSFVTALVALLVLLGGTHAASALECTEGNKVIQKGDLTLKFTVTSHEKFLSYCTLHAAGGIDILFPPAYTSHEAQELNSPANLVYQSFFFTLKVGNSSQHGFIRFTGLNDGLVWQIVNDSPTNRVVWQPNTASLSAVPADVALEPSRTQLEQLQRLGGAGGTPEER